MDEELLNKLKILDLEKIAYALFIIASIINLFGNKQTREFILNGKKPDNNVRKEFIISSFLILIVFIIFTCRNYYNLQKLTPYDEEYKIAKLRLIGSILLVIGQATVVYYFYYTATFQNNTFSKI